MKSIRREAERAMGTGVDIVCSEFYAPYHQHERAMRGNLRLVLNGLRSARIGGQIWSILESNNFAPNVLRQGWREEVPVPVEPRDGLLVPHDPPSGVNGTRLRLAFANPTWRQARQEINDLLAWTNGTWPI
jgi:hypothetical protein